MGKRHARVLASRADRFELVGVMDLEASAALELAQAHGVAAVAMERDAIERAEGVIVATPIRAHALTVRRALVQGRHVLVEKPVAADAREARELMALAESSGARLFVGHSERFNPVVRALSRLVDPASVRAIEFRRFGSTRVRLGGNDGVLINLGVHDIDLAAYLAGSAIAPLSVRAETDMVGADERADVTGRTESGASVQVVVDQRPADGKRRRSVVVTTPTHVWHGDLLVPSLVRACIVTGAREVIPLDTEEPLLAQALAFGSAAMGSGASEIATGEDGMRALIVAERARQVAEVMPADKRSWGKVGVSARF